MEKPYTIKLSETVGKGGKLSFIEGNDIPFEVQRVFWIYDINEETRRGGHAHRQANQLLVCLQGTVQVMLENQQGEKYTFSLNNACEALFFPKMHWLDMHCSKNTVMMVLASNTYSEEGYIKVFEDFQKHADGK